MSQTQVPPSATQRRVHQNRRSATTFPQELAALLHYNGFTILRQYGDWNEEPLTGNSPSISVVCRKRT